MGWLYLSSGQRIYYTAHGPADGRGVLLLHGWCATGNLWSEQVEALVHEGYRVITIDSAGHGRSSKRNDDVDMDAMADFTKEICEQTGLADEPAAIIGHSAGGAIAMATYFKYPELYSCMVLLQTGYKMCDTPLRKLIWENAAPFVEIGFSTPAKLISRSLMNSFAWLASAIYGTEPAKTRAWIMDIQRTRSKVARAELEEIVRHDISDRLPSIKVPTLIIGGTFDLLAPARQSIRMGELIPDSEVHIRPMNHMGKMLKPHLVNPLILDFLSRHYPL